MTGWERLRKYNRKPRIHGESEPTSTAGMGSGTFFVTRSWCCDKLNLSMLIRERQGNWAWYPFDRSDVGILWCQDWFWGRRKWPAHNPIFRLNSEEQYLNVGPLMLCWGRGSCDEN